MRRLFLIAAGLFLFPTLAAAQIGWLHVGYGNAFRGFPGALNNHSAIMGFEYAPKLLGAGFEWELRSVCNKCDFRGSLTVNGYYHLPLGKRKQDFDQLNEPFVPFITAGYSRAFRPYNTGLNMLNFGGGADFFGFVRFEIRDSLSFENAVAHHPEFRIGLNLAPLFIR